MADPETDNSEYVSVAEATRITGFSPSRLNRLVAAGEVRAQAKANRRALLYCLADLENVSAPSATAG